MNNEDKKVIRELLNDMTKDYTIQVYGEDYKVHFVTKRQFKYIKENDTFSSKEQFIRGHHSLTHTIIANKISIFTYSLCGYGWFW